MLMGPDEYSSSGTLGLPAGIDKTQGLMGLSLLVSVVVVQGAVGDGMFCYNPISPFQKVKQSWRMRIVSDHLDMWSSVRNVGATACRVQ